MARFYVRETAIQNQNAITRWNFSLYLYEERCVFSRSNNTIFCTTIKIIHTQKETRILLQFGKKFATILFTNSQLLSS